MTNVNIEKFLKQWNKNEEILKEHIAKAIKEAASDTFDEIVDITPVGDPAKYWKSPPPSNYEPGTLQQNWEISFDDGASYIQPRSKGNFTSRISTQVGGAKLEDIIIRNQTPYAERIEYGRWSQQAPRGMMRIGAKSFSKYLKQRVRQNRV